jgi:hypothetical protein
MNGVPFISVVVGLSHSRYERIYTHKYGHMTTACMQKLLDGLTVTHLFIILVSLVDYWNFFYTTGYVPALLCTYIRFVFSPTQTHSHRMH